MPSIKNQLNLFIIKPSPVFSLHCACVVFAAKGRSAWDPSGRASNFPAICVMTTDRLLSIKFHVPSTYAREDLVKPKAMFIANLAMLINVT